MILPRIIPSLLLSGRGLVKGINYRNHRYIGDPINIVRIFNCKSVDELLFLDINATKENRIPPIQLLENIADECLVPFGIGGGIRSLIEIESILKAGAEKVCVGSAAFGNIDFISEAANSFGSQSIMVSVDVKRNGSGKPEVYVKSGLLNTRTDPVGYAKKIEQAGAGEILLNSIDKDGTMTGYDIPLIYEVAKAVNIPVIACGGAGRWQDLATAIKEGGCQAAAAGSLFVFHGPRRAVLVNYPSPEELEGIRKQ
jgi:cyclase